MSKLVVTVGQTKVKMSGKPPPKKRQRVAMTTSKSKKSSTPRKATRITTPPVPEAMYNEENSVPPADQLQGPVQSPLSGVNIADIVSQVVQQVRQETATIVADVVNQVLSAKGLSGPSTAQNESSEEQTHSARDIDQLAVPHQSTAHNQEDINGLPAIQRMFEGEDIANRPANEAFLTCTSSLPLGYNVSDKIRAKIMENEFIEFGELVFPSYESEQTKLKLTYEGNGLGLTASSKAKSVANISQWNQAFDIFVSIYTEKFPEKISHLLKYGNTMRLLNQNYGFQAVKFYDENFRKLRRTQPVNWNIVHDELWRMAAMRINHVQTPYGKPNQAKPFSQNSQPFRGKFQQKPKLPYGYCWGFALEGTCKHGSSCRFKHECCVCGKKIATKNCHWPINQSQLRHNNVNSTNPNSRKAHEKSSS
ncbi:uncharacterized protein LOC117326494 [Pecten maximus]|uniref:uncharacterized protein LOC117326494 n=1 Tax=Pecten maximus TaxID=6579 RepID=UPI00145867F2|nr:uncharacterized protein LOC117326494 [Pecten maximus]